MNVLWGLLAAVSLFWPGRIHGPLDGLPLEHAAEAILLGLVFPALYWFDRAFLDRRRARVLIVLLLTWKAVTFALLVPDGWCVTLMPSRPYVEDQTGRPHSWDVRADWRSPDPACSAVMTRSYAQMEEFPVWFFNLPAANGDLPRPEDVPPGAITRMRIAGTLTASARGVLRIESTPAIATSARVDGGSALADGSAEIGPGSHLVSVDATLTKNAWGLRLLWNGGDLFERVVATASPPSVLDRMVRPWGRWVSAVLALALLLTWMLTSLAHVLDGWSAAWVLLASGAMGLAALLLPEQRWQWAALALASSALLPATGRATSVRAAFVFIGVPWLVLVVVATRYSIGRITFYAPGNDYWLFQRWAYRIVLQGFWLEGGEKTFWFQPLYRWIAGVLHVLFGDSSVGETYWNGTCLAVMALFAFVVTRAYAGVRWGLVAAATTLAMFLGGPGFIFVRGGLSEISSAGFIYLGALFASRARRGAYVTAVAVGACAALGVYTRLNNLPMAVAIVCFAWPLATPIGLLRRPREWFAGASAPTMVIVIGALGAGLMLFAWRTYHYTGVFSVTLGTALDPQRGNARIIWAQATSMRAWLFSMYDSLMMVLTTTDPPRVHHGALPLIAAAMLSVAAAVGVPPLETLPLPAVLFMLASLAGSLVARGTAYPGRFSIHVLGAAATVVVCATAGTTRWGRQLMSRHAQRADVPAPTE